MNLEELRAVLHSRVDEFVTRVGEKELSFDEDEHHKLEVLVSVEGYNDEDERTYQTRVRMTQREWI